MPAWAEWLARPLSWLGGMVGVTVVVATVVTLLVRRSRAADAVLLVVVALGSQLLVQTAKAGYERRRPDVGSAIDLPSSFSFPSGHAATGVAVFGLLGLIAAATASTRARRDVAVVVAFALGVLIGASRVVLNVHYVTDVLAGACLGLAWLLACLLVLDLLRR
jgi:undecaprenyl-diphosphatase